MRRALRVLRGSACIDLLFGTAISPFRHATAPVSFGCSGGQIPMVKTEEKLVRGAVRYVDRRQIFAEHEFFRGMSPAVIEELAARSRVEQFPRGKTIFAKGSPGRALMAVLAGSVKICSVSRGGREAVLNVIGPGTVFGEIAVLDGGARTADAVAGAACEVLVLDRRDFLPILEANPALAQRLLEILCGRLRRTSEQLEDTFFLDLPGRLAKALLRPADGGGAKNRGTEGPIAVTQRELGEMIGMSRESINKQLRKWQSEGIVAIAKGRIAVKNRDALRAIAQVGESEAV